MRVHPNKIINNVLQRLVGLLPPIGWWNLVVDLYFDFVFLNMMFAAMMSKSQPSLLCDKLNLARAVDVCMNA